MMKNNLLILSLIKQSKIGIYLLVALGACMLYLTYYIFNIKNIDTANSQNTLSEIEFSNGASLNSRQTGSLKTDDFESLVGFWQENFLEEPIEADYNSLMSASNFFTIYSPLAEQGDHIAKYLVSRMVNNCMAAMHNYSFNKEYSAHTPNKENALWNDYQRCKDLMVDLSTSQKQAYSNNAFLGEIFGLLFPETSIDFDNLDSFPVREAKMKIYKQFNSGTTGVLRKPIDKEAALWFEAISKVQDPVSLHASFFLLSTSGAGSYAPFNEELTSWLLASCASGFGCNDYFSVSDGFAVLCSNRNIECFNKSPEELVSELAPNSTYNDILKRAKIISERIVDGEQDLLVLELLSTMSPENASVFESIVKNNAP